MDKDTPEAKSKSLAEKWLKAIDRAGKLQQSYEQRVDNLYKVYESAETQSDDRKKFNILWSNIETLKPAMYAKLPKPLCSRRFKGRDPVGLKAAMMIERALDFHLDCYDFDSICREAREDYLLPGRVVTRVVYTPHFGEEKKPKISIRQREDGTYHDEAGNDYDGDMEEQDGELFGFGESYRPVDFEEVGVKEIHVKDFRHGPGRKWSEVSWCAFREYLTKSEAKTRFSDVANNLDYNHKEDVNDEDAHYADNKVAVWEVWDKSSKRVIWVAEGYKDGVLEEGEPPLKMKNFWPCPKPLITGNTNRSLTPIPDYIQYQDQQEEINELSERISMLVKSLKVVGAYAAGPSEGGGNALEQMLTEGFENELIPVDDWAAFAERGGIEGLISWLPIEQVAKVVIQLYEAREKTKQEVFEISGLADVIRGASNPNETATAQGIKGRYAGMRLSDRQTLFAQYLRDVIELMAEVMAEHFSIETLAMISGVEVLPEEVPMLENILRNDLTRGFNIDIETDSTLMPDEEADKRSRMEFLEAVGGFLERAIPASQAAPELGQFFGEAILFAARGFRAGRELEESLEQGIKAMLNKPPPQPQPNPKIEEAKMNAEIKTQEHQQGMQFKQEEHRQDMQHEQQKFQADMTRKFQTI